MVEFWKMLGLFLGFGGPRREEQGTVAMARGPAGASWAMGFDTVLPGIRAVQAYPVGPGRNMLSRIDSLTVLDVFRLFEAMIQVREAWPFGPDPEAFAGYVALEGPGWNMTVYFPSGAPRVEYYAGRSGDGPRVTGQVRWELLAQALVLSPDYDAVIGYLTLNPYHVAYRPA